MSIPSPMRDPQTGNLLAPPQGEQPVARKRVAPGTTSLVQAARSRPSRILVVEDHQALANYVTVVLQHAGHIVVGPAITLASAVELARSATIDIALVDIGLCGEHSFALLDALGD